MRIIDTNITRFSETGDKVYNLVQVDTEGEDITLLVETNPEDIGDYIITNIVFKVQGETITLKDIIRLAKYSPVENVYI